MIVIEGLSLQPGHERLKTHLLRAANKPGEGETTHQQIALALDTAREVVSRELQELSRAGAIATYRGRIRILQLSKPPAGASGPSRVMGRGEAEGMGSLPTWKIHSDMVNSRTVNACWHESDELEDRGFACLLGCVGAMPLFSYLALALFAAMGFVATGHWPSYGNPDPKALSMALIAPIWMAIAASALAGPTYAVVFTAHVIHRRWQLSMADRFGLAAWVTGVLLWAFAARGLLNWLAD